MTVTTRLKRKLLALSQFIFILSEENVHEMISSVDNEVFNKKNWNRLHAIGQSEEVGPEGQYGYQRTDGTSIMHPIIYLVELHMFKNLNTGDYRSFIISVKVDDITEQPQTNIYDIKILNHKEIGFSKSVFKENHTLANGNVIKFDGYRTFDAVFDARNNDLKSQGKPEIVRQ